jgi:hypothetical protein
MISVRWPTCCYNDFMGSSSKQDDCRSRLVTWKAPGADRVTEGVDSARLYLRDFGELVKDLARTAKDERDEAPRGEDRAYALGRLMALHELVSLMQQQADAFGLSYRDLSLHDIEPERDLL